MTREASVATLRRLAEAASKDLSEDDLRNRPELDYCVRQYRSEIAPLRTRAEIDADIAALTRQCVDDEWAGDDDYAKWEKITALCREPTAPEAEPFQATSTSACHWCQTVAPVTPHGWDNICEDCLKRTCDWCDDTSKPRLYPRRVTATTLWVCRACLKERGLNDSGPSSADAEEVPSPRPPASPAGADYSGPKPFGLTNEAPVYEPALASRRALEAIAVALDGTWSKGLNVDPSVTRALMAYRVECSGPPGAVAAKESRDNAAAPEGAAKAESHACNPGERECNCDQALGLEQKLADIRTEYDLWIRCKKGCADTLGAIRLILGVP